MQLTNSVEVFLFALLTAVATYFVGHLHELQAASDGDHAKLMRLPSFGESDEYETSLRYASEPVAHLYAHDTQGGLWATSGFISLLEAEPWRGILLVNPRLKPNLEKPLAHFAAIIENTVDRPQEKYGVPQLMRMLKLSRVQTPKIPLEFGGGLCASFDA